MRSLIRPRLGLALALSSLLAVATACASGEVPADDTHGDSSDSLSNDPDHPGVARRVLYEIQARTANACRVDVGDASQRAACAAKPAPTIPYRAEGESCPIAADLEAIKLGTLDDLLDDTADYRKGITLRYVNERVGADTVWLMPIFPDNDRWSIPDACDNLGSPYAVRDYFHVTGTLARSCIAAGRDEGSATPCWGNDTLDQVIAAAHARGMKVVLDVALNHFGHNYLFYDVARFTPVRERIARGENLDTLWSFDRTFDPALLTPEVLDRPAALDALAASDPQAAATLAALRARCPALTGDPLVRAFATWRDALDGERAKFPCDAAYLEYQAPGFYQGADRWNPSTGVGDNYAGDGYDTWHDVKFLYHHEENPAHRHEFVRNREYLFRVLNYWTARGVDGFRLDHTTDPGSGLSPNEWRYVLGKVAYYARRRGQVRPFFLAEEFHDQQGIADVVDTMTEGYATDMTARYGETKDAARIERIVSNLGRFGPGTFVMTALETHDERRLVDGTGFDVWTGAGFWGVGATTQSTPMLLMGQELGEPDRLDFRRSSLLWARFAGTFADRSDGNALVDYYGTMVRARLAPENRALLAPSYAFLRPRGGNGTAPDSRIFAQVKWSSDLNVVFTFFNLWPVDAWQSYFISPELGQTLGIRDDSRYRLVDAFSGVQQGACHLGRDLKWSLDVHLDSGTRMQWLRLEMCP